MARLEHLGDAGGGTTQRTRAMAELATRQHGVVAHRQLLMFGLGRGAIGRRLRTGGLHRVHVGVYAVGHSRLTAEGRWMAAVLACGQEAVLSHTSAAALWGLRPTAGIRVHVTAPGNSRPSRPGIALHRTRQLQPEDHTHLHGIPVSTVARTLLDLAETVRRTELERAFEAAERLRVLDLRAVEATCRRNRGRHGLRSLVALLADARDVPETRSQLERRFLRLCRDAGLPEPSVNVMVAGYEVDFAWPNRRLVVELDGHEFHRTRAAFERDRVRDAALQLAGQRVIRLTHRRLARDAHGIVATLRSLLADP